MPTKKDFIKTAARIAALVSTNNGDLKSIREMAHGMADDYAQSNPAFDRARFLKACGV